METEQTRYQADEIVEDPPQPKESNNKPGVIILQWLTYALWGWTIVALGSLLATTLTYIIVGADTSGFTPYGIAASLVLAPIAMACDIFYSKYEPAHKTGAAMIVMVIHAVLFALLGIGSLISAVFALIQLFISSEQNNVVIVTLLTLSTLVFFYTATFLRTLNPAKIAWFRTVYIAMMPTITLVVIGISIAGPLRYQQVTKNDRLVSANISSVVNSINQYAKNNNQLPSSLNDVTFTGDAQKVIAKNLIQYKANTKLPQASSSFSRTTNNKVFFYNLCVNYVRESKNGATNVDTNRYSEYISAYEHGAGEVCYKVSTDYVYQPSVYAD